MAKTKEVAKKEKTELFSNERPEWMEDSNRGSEDVGMEDIALPRISIIQDLSPQHKSKKPEYIEGAEVGMIFNTVSTELYGDKVIIVPVFYRKEWVLWVDQSAGGGFRGAFDTELEAKQELNDMEDSSDVDVVDTAQHYVLIIKPLADGAFDIKEAIISMSKSQMKVNRKFNSQIRMLGGDRFSRVYTLAVVEDQNAAGQEYYNWKVTPLGYAPKAVFDAAEQMYEAIQAGKKTINREAPVESDEVDHGDPDEVAGKDQGKDEF